MVTFLRLPVTHYQQLLHLLNFYEIWFGQSLQKKLSSKREFSEVGQRDIRGLFNDVNEYLPDFSITDAA